MKLAILHFQPLEKYPPVMNCIIDLEGTNIKDVRIISTRCKNNWFTSKFKIFRLGNYSNSILSRYFTYLYFNLASLYLLIRFKPTTILYYETYSSWPVFWYLKLFPSTNLYIHFHEYYSAVELATSSSYFKFLLKYEVELFHQAKWISHTNKDRLNFFLKDYPFINNKQGFVLPNYPPKDWNTIANAIRSNNFSPEDCINIVYLGALGISSTYIVEFSNWIHIQGGKFQFTIYTDNIENEVINHLHTLNSPFIHLKTSIPYYQLPHVLAKYDIGVVFYKGHIPNYIFNIPNKVFEYLACGLEVWYSKELLSTHNFHSDFKLASLKQFDFKSLTPVVSINNENTYNSDSINFPENFLIDHLLARA